MSLFARTRAALAFAVLSTTVGAHVARAQEWTEKFSFHGSLNQGYGKSDGLGVFGINKDGTTDYRAVALQFGYKFDSNDRVVVQLLNRGVGASPLKDIMPELSPVWAFYEKKIGGYTVKVGRNPLPRGIFNEVRFVGTLLPLFREALYGETLENIDGIVVTKSFELGQGFGIDANAVAGEFDVKYTLPSATGVTVGSLRMGNSVGTQLWLRLPVKGLRVGTFLDRYQGKPFLQHSQTQKVKMFSVDGDFTHFFARAEYQKFYSGKGKTATDYHAAYAQAGVNVTDKVTLVTEYNTASNLLHFTPTIPDVMLNLNKDVTGGITYAPSANVKFKFEGHRADGYSFDTAVPTIIPPTSAPFVMRAAPRSKAYYGILSLAVSF
ncbi:MAG: hypothetical protein ABI852_16990 [Gemmatimonadaceae bacterium]